MCTTMPSTSSPVKPWSANTTRQRPVGYNPSSIVVAPVRSCTPAGRTITATATSNPSVSVTT